MLLAPVMVLGLAGCVFDGFKLSEGQVELPLRRVEAVPDRGTYRAQIGNETIFSRFVRIGDGRYAWEMLVQRESDTSFQVLEAAFHHLDGKWHALHWRSPTGRSQGMHLVQVDSSAIAFAEVTKQRQMIWALGQQGGVQVDRGSVRNGLPLGDTPANVLAAFLRVSTSLPEISFVRSAAAAPLPPLTWDLGRKRVLGQIVSLDAPEVIDRAKATRMRNYFAALHEEGRKSKSRIAIDGSTSNGSWIPRAVRVPTCQSH